jgi:P pilus assembly chaperone PapD
MSKNIFYVDQGGKFANTAFKTTKIRNTNKNDTFNVMARIYKVTRTKGKQGETRTQTGDVSVFPPFFTLKPNSQQKVRIIARTIDIPNDEESVYRVQFIPQNPVSDKKDLKIITSVGALVFVKPTNIIGDIAWKRNSQALIIKNKSNTNIVLGNTNSCKKTFSCIANNVRLWPGDSWRINIPRSLINSTFNLEKYIYGVSQNVEIGK